MQYTKHLKIKAARTLHFLAMRETACARNGRLFIARDVDVLVSAPTELPDGIYNRIGEKLYPSELQDEYPIIGEARLNAHCNVVRWQWEAVREALAKEEKKEPRGITHLLIAKKNMFGCDRKQLHRVPCEPMCQDADVWALFPKEPLDVAFSLAKEYCRLSWPQKAKEKMQGAEEWDGGSSFFRADTDTGYRVEARLGREGYPEVDGVMKMVQGYPAGIIFVDALVNALKELLPVAKDNLSSRVFLHQKNGALQITARSETKGVLETRSLQITPGQAIGKPSLLLMPLTSYEPVKIDRVDAQPFDAERFLKVAKAAKAMTKGAELATVRLGRHKSDLGRPLALEVGA